MQKRHYQFFKTDKLLNAFVARILMCTLLLSSVSLGASEGASSSIATTGASRSNNERVSALIQYAIENEATVDAANYRAENDASIAGTRWTALLPRLDLSASYTRLQEIDLPPFDVGAGPMPNPFPQILDNWNLKASLALPLSQYFTMILPRMKQSKLQEAISLAQSAQVRERIAVQSEQMFWGLASLRSQARNLESTKKRVGLALELNEKLFAAGQLPKVELDAMKAQVANIDTALSSIEAQDQLMVSQIAAFIGLSHDELQSKNWLPLALSLDDLMNEVKTRDAAKLKLNLNEALVQSSYAQRPELNALNETLHVMEQEVKVSKRSGLPSINLLGNYSYANPNQRFFPLTNDWNGSWDITLAAGWSPNDYIASLSRTKRTRSDQREVQANLNALKRQIRSELMSALTELENAKRSLESASVDLRIERSRREQSQTRLKAGAISSFEDLDREAALEAAENKVLNEFVKVSLAESTLYRVLGIASSPTRTHDIQQLANTTSQPQANSGGGAS